MKKSFWVGFIVLALIVGAGLVWRFVLSDEGAVGTDSGTNSGALQTTHHLPSAKAEPLRISGIGGYTLGSVDLGDGPVPLLTIPLDTWGGYAALFWANRGHKPNRESLFYQKGKFAVELVPEEETSKQLEGYASGRFPVIWSSMDTLPLLYDALKQDRRVSPQVIGLFDWSVGGDGIVVRDFIKKPADLKGKTILTSSPSPYSFFLLWYLAQIDINPLDVKVVHVDNGPEAVKTFKDNPGVGAWVTWTPFLSDVTQSDSPDYVPGTRLLISSQDANQLIADVVVMRSDMIREKPELVKAFTESMAEAAGDLMVRPELVYPHMIDFYQLGGGPAEARELLSEVHLANFPETQMFFSPDNPIGAHKIFFLAQEYYKLLGILAPDAAYEADRVLYSGARDQIAAAGLFKAQVNRMQNSFNRDAAFNIGDLEGQRMVLAKDLRLYFEAQRLDFDVGADTEDVRQNLRLLEQVKEQMAFLGTTVVRLVGHLDTARVQEYKSQGTQVYVEASAQAKLISKRRADFVKSLLVSRFKVDADRIITAGLGWDQPLDVQDPAQNRRVEVQFLSLE